MNKFTYEQIERLRVKLRVHCVKKHRKYIDKARSGEEIHGGSDSSWMNGGAPLDPGFTDRMLRAGAPIHER